MAKARSGVRREGSASDQVGERLATLRTERNLRVSELARRVGVSPSLISQIERGQSQPSVSTLFGLAEALEVPLDAFFDKREGARPPRLAAAADESSPQSPSERYVVRRSERAEIDIEGGVHWERLTPATLPDVDFLELVYAPGAESNPGLYRHPGTEMVLVLSGRLDIFVGFERYSLDAGDSIHFPSSAPHRYVNATDQDVRAVTVILHDSAGAPPSDSEQRRP
jgi:transcriptional regulator with XRE-family HTH domain